MAIPATLPLAVRVRYSLPAFLVGFGSLLLMTQVSPRFDERGLTFVLLYVFWLYSLGANTRGRPGVGRRRHRCRWCIARLRRPTTATAFHPGDIAFGAFIIGGPSGSRVC